ncbi:hypothetical protein [Streptomyces sp. NPDC047973]|uniref:hypothetical protein n=1 Tax=Streptomyces sp. NPDC047973 TaxID=3155383 RepID=UPI0034379B59
MPASERLTMLTHGTVLRSRDRTGHVMLDWEPVPGATGYLVRRADHYEGPYTLLHTAAVCRPHYADTRVEPGRGYWYTVAPSTPDGARTPLPEPVSGCPLAPGAEAARVGVEVDARAYGAVHVTGDGARGLVTATAGEADGALEVRLANAAHDRPGSAPVPALARQVVVEISGLEPGTRYRIGADVPGHDHSAHADQDGHLRTSLNLPMPGRRTLRLARVRAFHSLPPAGVETP